MLLGFLLGATFNVIRGGGLFSMIMGGSPAKSCLVGIWAQMMAAHGFVEGLSCSGTGTEETNNKTAQRRFLR